MKTQAFFEKIHTQIEFQLKRSQVSIKIAVAWFTDGKLFDILLQKLDEGVKVELLLANNDINFNSNIKFTEIKRRGGEFYWVGDNFAYAPLMHNKFCIIVNKILIFGSYNWTKKAKSNHESITIIEGDDNLILDFNQEFDKIKQKAKGIIKEIFIDWAKVILRLGTIRNAIKLEDNDDIKYQVSKLKLLAHNSINDKGLDTITQVISLCDSKNYREALYKIQAIVANYKKVTIFHDPYISALKLEIRGLEFQIATLESEKTDIEKLISGFNDRYNRDLGKIIKKILLLKGFLAKKELDKDKENVEKQNSYQEAQKEYKDFSYSYNKALEKPKRYSLGFHKQIELKKMFRKASLLCHPDKVTEAQKVMAEKIFYNLREAYEKNDFKKVSEILKDLEKGIFTSQGETIDELKKLKSVLHILVIKREEIEKNLNSLKESRVYHKINKITDFDYCFSTTKSKFETILVDLKLKSENER